MAMWERWHDFIGNFGEKAPFYWLFEKGGTILLGQFRRRLMMELTFMSKTMLEVGWRLEFHFMVHALPKRLVI